MILLIDNYDSFTYNLYQYITEDDKDIHVRYNDEITIEEITALNPDKIIITPKYWYMDKQLNETVIDIPKDWIQIKNIAYLHALQLLIVSIN